MRNASLVFLGHVNAGKSTVCGVLSGAARPGEPASWVADTEPEERACGNTLNVGTLRFDTATVRYTVLDAPGHRNLVPRTVSAVMMADTAVLVISARRGELESGLRGQTAEHAVLARAAGMKSITVLVNKMDAVGWSKERFDECVSAVQALLRKLRLDAAYVPCSASTGEGLVRRRDGWGPSLAEHLDGYSRDSSSSTELFAPVYESLGAGAVLCKVEAGSLSTGDTVTIFPSRSPAVVEAVIGGSASAGEIVGVRLRPPSARPGCVLAVECPTGRVFEARLLVLDGLVTAGYSAACHIRGGVERFTVTAVAGMRIARSGNTAYVRLEFDRTVCAGRFIVRDGSKTVAVGMTINTA